MRSLLKQSRSQFLHSEMGMETRKQAGSIWFLSEMAVSDQHGGGVTLCRTLGRNMEGFNELVCLSDFYEAAPRFSDRYHKWTSFFRTSRCRRLLGCRLSEWCFRQPWVESWFARQCAAKIHALLPADQSHPFFLVSPQSTLAVRTLEELKKRRALSYATWVMDDNWVKQDQGGGWTYAPQVETILQRHFKEADAVVTISEPMGEHYRQRFGVGYDVLFAPSPYDEVVAPADFVPARKLAYFGTLSIWPGDALARLVPLLTDLGLTMDIYSHHPLPADLQHPCVFKMPPLAPEEVQATMRKYDAVLLPIGFSPATASYTHFNIATKMAECLGSGTVTLAIGPEHAAMMRYLNDHDAGLCVSEPNMSTLSEALRVIHDPSQRKQRIEKDLAHVRSYLTRKIMHRRWEAIRDRIMAQSST
ncbi:MAG: glycosyltransferase [Prosthecobacter sp.]|uniref:glycosyltransferase n=1 Tax=Prosthecobacter sp. TaxID=1965333 RepID=UPI0025CE7FFC|nr:glycosyltransferase [Prosthecobacter sp.]MCF7785938.1 glycosyltransferase [Prosthecobacter sp.]